MLEVKIKYKDELYPRIEKEDYGDWVDLRAYDIIKFKSGETGRELSKKEWKQDRRIEYKKGDVLLIDLGIAMELPEGYEAYVVPRSSTFNSWGLIQTNHVGVIDNSYRGDTDYWKVEFKALKDGVIRKYDRLCQFRIQKNQPKMVFKEVERLGSKNRGGHGTTGKN